MTHEAHSGPRVDWSSMIESMHERSWHRLHESPSVLLARRERTWRLLDRQAPIPGLPDVFCPRPAFDD